VNLHLPLSPYRARGREGERERGREGVP